MQLETTPGLNPFDKRFMQRTPLRVQIFLLRIVTGYMCHFGICISETSFSVTASSITPVFILFPVLKACIFYRVTVILMIDRVNFVTDRVNSMMDRVISVTNRVNSMTDRLNSVADRVNSITDRVISVTVRVNSMTDRVIPVTERVNSMTERVNS